MKIHGLYLVLTVVSILAHAELQTTNRLDSKKMIGGWETTGADGATGQMIVIEDLLSITYYKSNPNEFVATWGGKWTTTPGGLEIHWEFNTAMKELVGQTKVLDAEFQDDVLTLDGNKWRRIDDGSPGSLNGAWVITGRVRDGEVSTRTPGARKTMKILSGTFFQWIAYNSETGDFSGTGGGKYTSIDGKYTEAIRFFSRDNTRVGATLEFDYQLKDGQWHHMGKSSRGEPLYEIWSTRKSLGI